MTTTYTTITIDDDDEMMLIKKAILELTPVQRKIFLTYVDVGTYTGAAKEFKVSVPTIKKYIGSVKEKIYEYVDSHIAAD